MFHQVVGDTKNIPKDKQQIQSELKFINMNKKTNQTWLEKNSENKTILFYFNVEEGNDKQEKFLFKLFTFVENGNKKQQKINRTQKNSNTK